MTDAIPMRERLAAIVYDTAIISNEYGTDPDIANSEAIVDAILSVLETPSVGMLLAGKSAWAEGGGWIDTYAAMVKAIRGGV